MIDTFFQRLAGFEFHCFGCGNLYHFTGTGIPAIPFRTLRYLEGSESGENNFFTLGKCLCYDLCKRFQHLFGFRPGNLILRCSRLCQFLLIHSLPFRADFMPALCIHCHFAAMCTVTFPLLYVSAGKPDLQPGRSGFRSSGAGKASCGNCHLLQHFLILQHRIFPACSYLSL